MQTEHSKQPQLIGSIVGGVKFDERDAHCATHGDYKEHGTFLAGEMRWIGCTACSEARRKEEDRKRAEEHSRTARRDALLSGWKGAAIPKRFESASFETYQVETPAQQQVLDACREYAAQWDEVSATGRNLIMCGLFGTGKTHLAISIARVVARRGALPLFARTYEAVQFVRETYRRDSSMSEREAIRRLVEPDLLVLDEVGVQGGGDNEQMILFAILNGRYDARKPTIIASNEDLGGIEKYLSARVVDRLREGGGRVLAFDWDSHRARA
jgi:DNA replication protein DnaC